VIDDAGRVVEVSGRGLLNGEPARLSVEGGPWQPITAWAGPWPVTERWWAARRRRARVQVVTDDGVARLLCAERAQWWVEALYD
jgi:protein ImuB